MGKSIRIAREKIGLTQEELADGICSVVSLSRIENGNAGVSYSTFQALMSRMGVKLNVSSSFINELDFECFYTLKKIRYLIHMWRYEEAYEELEKVETYDFANNKLYYQEWLILYSYLFQENDMYKYQLLHLAFDITRKNIDIFHLERYYLSYHEMEILILLGNEYLYNKELEKCCVLCKQIETYLDTMSFEMYHKYTLRAQYEILYTKYLLSVKKYKKAYENIEKARQKAVESHCDTPTHELTFLTGIACYFCGDNESALKYIKIALYSYASMKSCQTSICIEVIKKYLGMDFLAEVSDIISIKQPYFEKKPIKNLVLSNGIEENGVSDKITIGKLIGILRRKQNLSQKILCYGICSESKLSKIENGELTPDFFQTQVLLQRLGLSDLYFSFYVKETDVELYNYKQELIIVGINEIEKIEKLIDSIKKSLKPNDKLNMQFILSYKAAYQSDIQLQIKMLEEALQLTLPNFTFERIKEYRISKSELDILNLLATSYVDSGKVTEGISCLYRILDYLETVADFLYKERMLGITIGFLNYSLYKQQRFYEIAELVEKKLIACRTYYMGNICAHYYQAVLKLDNNKPDRAILYAKFSYYNFKIAGYDKVSEKLIEDTKENGLEISF